MYMYMRLGQERNRGREGEGGRREGNKGEGRKEGGPKRSMCRHVRSTSISTEATYTYPT